MLYLPREEGQGLSEYALLLGFIALIVIVVLYALGPAVGNLYSTIYAGWTAAVPAG
jgi:Flp pilus assembly pilin Flp